LSFLWPKIESLHCFNNPDNIVFRPMPKPEQTINEVAKLRALKICDDLVQWRGILDSDPQSKHISLNGETGWRGGKFQKYRGTIEFFEIFLTTLFNCSLMTNRHVNIYNVIDEIDKIVNGADMPAILHQLKGFGILQFSSTINRTEKIIGTSTRPAIIPNSTSKLVSNDST